jgi:4-amino-4-deoxy-L-arabinose transferase-like glycosyltransferase
MPGSNTTFPLENSPTPARIEQLLVAIIALSVIIRGVLAWWLELGNDEVYYWTYALYPALSHFDHPPMVGLFIQAFSFNLHWDNELFLRLSSVILGGVNTFIIYKIGREVKNPLTGLYAALLYNASVYCFVIAGIFILPDTPQLFFWLLSLYFLITSLPAKPIEKKHGRRLLLAAALIGLAMLSKYTSVFLWLGAGLYILIYNRAWLRRVELYLGVVLSLIIFIPVIIWNFQNDFISFTFQSERVGFFSSGLRLDYFFTELFGQIGYNNPVNFVLIVFALIAIFRKRKFLAAPQTRILLLTSLPLIGLFLFFAFFRRTLPHWTGPAYLSLIIIAAAWLADIAARRKKPMLWIPRSIIASVGLLMVVLILGMTEIKTGLLTPTQYDDPREVGSNDVTLDMYGWRQLATKFDSLVQADVRSGYISADAPIISHRWFPAAHLDYYVAHPLGIPLIAIGSLEDIHKYAWINHERPPLQPDSDAWYITGSRDFDMPGYLFEYYKHIETPDIIKIYKGNKHVENFFVYRLRGLYKQPDDVLGKK